MAADPEAPPTFFAIPIDIKRRLKVTAARTGRTMRGIVTAAIVAEIERIEREEADLAPGQATGT